MLSDPALLIAVALVGAAVAGLWIWHYRLENWARDLRVGLDAQSRSLRVEFEAFDRHCQRRLEELARRLRK